MSIHARLDDAKFLWKNERYEGAFLSVLVAVAATARLRYPHDKDGEAFRQFMKSGRGGEISVEFRGELFPVEQVFYKWLRCELVHLGGLPIDIQLMPDAVAGALTIRAGGRPEYVLKLSHGWFDHLLGLVANAPENRGVFTK